MMKRTGKIGTDAGGTFITEFGVHAGCAACWTENVDNCARHVLSIIVQPNIGMIRKTTFTSSACSLVH
ncbi:hypothetical protein FRX31_015880, partial [Thalictrum thalictroides]